MLVSVAQTTRGVHLIGLVACGGLGRKPPWIIINSSVQCVANTHVGNHQIMVF